MKTEKRSASFNPPTKCKLLLDIISNGSQWEFGAVSFILWIPIFACNWTCASIRTSQTVHAYDKEPRDIECSARTSQERTPPVTNIRTPSQRMAYNHSIISVWGELSSCAVCEWDVV